MDILENLETGEEYKASDYTCEWFARCTNTAYVFKIHPVLQYVPICERCEKKA